MRTTVAIAAVLASVLVLLTACPMGVPETYTVTYEGNGATSGTVPATQTKSEGVDLMLAGNSGNLQRTGYNYAGWNTRADGGGTDYAEEAAYSVDADLTLYAKWTAGASYPSGELANPIGPSSGTNRVLRGGGWNSYASWCTVAYRYYLFPPYPSLSLGFRVVSR